MAVSSLSRRCFLGAIGAIGLGALTGCGGGGSVGAPVDTQTAYRLSVRGKRASNAAKSNAANKLFVDELSALAGRAHPGDPAVVVRVNVSEDFWLRHFGAGQTVVDFRHL